MQQWEASGSSRHGDESWREYYCITSITHDVRFDMDLWQESDSCAHFRERWLVFEADAAAFYVAHRLESSEPRSVAGPHKSLRAEQAFHGLSLDYSLAL
jgi:hypothetical protein